MQDNLEILRKHITHIHIIPMPSNCPRPYLEKGITECDDLPREETVFRTYANVIQINEDLLVPSFRDLAEIDSEKKRLEQTITTINEAIKEGKSYAKQIVLINDTDGLIAMQGNLHCMTSSKPK